MGEGHDLLCWWWGECLGMGTVVLNPSCESEAPGPNEEYHFVRGMGHQRAPGTQDLTRRAKGEAVVAMAL